MVKLKDIKMRPKLIGLFVITGILPLIFLGLWCSKLVGDALIERSYGQLEAVREIKKAQIQRLFELREGDIGVLIETVKILTQNAYQKLATVQELKKAYIEDYFETVKGELQILKNDPIVLSALTEFDTLLDQTENRVLSPEWNALAEQYDPRMEEIMKSNSWYDIFLMLPEGDIVYTVTRKPDLGMNIAEGKPKDSGLGRAFQIARNMNPEEIAIADFEPYLPSGGKYTAFMMAQVQDSDGQLKGYVAFQLPTDKINASVRHRQGMGETGETYLVGKWEGRISYRSDRVVKAGKIGDERTDTSIEEALAGKSGRKIKVGSTGVLELEMYNPLAIPGLNWGIITTQNLEEVIGAKLEGEEEDYFTRYVKKYGYYDLFMIHSAGDVFYSATREADYGTNMITGKYKDSGLGKLVQYILQTKQFTMTDFEPYEPSNNEPAAFIAQPVLSSDNQVEFIVALKLSLESINSVMEQREGMGESGETYLVGADMLMRSDSVQDSANRSVRASFANPTKGNVDTEAVKKALAGISGTEVIKNYADKKVLSAYTPMLVGATTWVLLAEIEENEVTQPIMKLIFSILQVGAVIVVIVAVFAFFIAKGIADPLAKSVDFTKSIAMGSFSVNIDILQKDEIGMLANALGNMNSTIRNVLKTLDDQIWAVQEGNLNSRGNATGFAGGWRALIAGINDLIDTLVGHIDNIPIATKITDKDFNIRYISKAGIEMLGEMDREQIIGEKCYRLFNTSACNTDGCTCFRVLQSGETAHSEAEAYLGGKEYYISTIGVPIKNAIGEITAGMEIMVDQTAVRKAMDNAGETAAGLLDSVHDLTVSSQEISMTSNEQASAVKEIVSTMEDSDQLAKSIAAKINDVTEMTNATKRVVDNGLSMIQDSLTKMNEIQQANAATIAEIQSLREKILNIWEIVNMINIIAAQTRIIAFNAELEASSAGEAGKNFQIVSSEIRRLADNIVDSTNEIKAKINEVQQSSDSLITVSKEGTVKITEGWELSHNLQKLFEDVLNSAEVSASAADRIAMSIKQQVSAFEQILQTLKQIAEGIDSFVGSTKATTGAAEKLREMANSLHTVIDDYAGREDEYAAHEDESEANNEQ